MKKKKKKYDCNNLMAKQLLGMILILIRSVHAFKKHHRESEVKCVNTQKMYVTVEVKGNGGKKVND